MAEANIQRLVRRALALCLTFALTAGLALPAFAENGDTSAPAPIQQSYEIEGVTYYNTNSTNFDNPVYYLTDLLNAKMPEFGNRSMADMWLEIGFGMLCADRSSTPDKYFEYVDKSLTSSQRNYEIPYPDDSGNHLEFRVESTDAVYAANFKQALNKLFPGAVYDRIDALKPYTSEADGTADRDVVAARLGVLDANPPEVDCDLVVYAYFTDFSAVVLTPDANGKDNYVPVTISDTGSITDKSFASDVKNLTSAQVTATQSLSTAWSNTVTSQVNGSESYTFGTSLTVGTEVGFEGVFKAKVEGTISQSDAFSKGWSQGESVSKSDTVSESVSVTLPPYTNVVLNQGHTDTVIETRYNCPIGIRYKVILCACEEGASRSEAFKASFEPDARADLYTRAIKNAAADIEEDKGALHKGIHWLKVLPVHDTQKLVELAATHAPIAPVGATFLQKLNTAYTEVKSIAPLEPLRVIKIQPPNVSFIDTEELSYQNLNYLRAEMKVGDSSYTNYLQLEGLNVYDSPYYGFSPRQGHWIVVHPDGSEWTGSDAPVVLTKDAASGYTRYTAVRTGTCFLKYIIDEDVYTTVTDADKYTKNADLLATAALEITVSGQKSYTNPQGIVTVSGSYVGAVGNEPENLERDGGLRVMLTDMSGVELDLPWFWQKQELDSRGIRVNDRNEFSFTKPGDYHVRAVCDELGAVSDWITIHAHNYSYTADAATLNAVCSEGDSSGAFTILPPAKTAYNDGLSPEATVTGSVPGVNTIAVTYSHNGTVLSGAPTDAGEYTASITLGGVAAEQSYTIRGNYVTKAPTARDLTYNAENQQLVLPGSAESVMYYALGGEAAAPADADFSAAIPEAVNAGTYHVWFRAVDPLGVYPPSAPIGPVSVTVKKASGKVPPAPKAAAVDAASITLETVDGCEYGIEHRLSLSEGNILRYFAWQDSPVFTNLAEDHSFTFAQRYKESDNYEPSGASEHLSISTLRAGEDPQILSDPGAKESLSCTGKAQTLIMDGGKVHNGFMQFALGESDDTAPGDESFSAAWPTGTHVGSYYVWYRGVGPAGTAPTAAKCLTVKIVQGTPQILLGKTDLPYTGRAQSLVPDAQVHPAGSFTVYYSLGDTENELLAPPMATDPGVYEVYYRIESNSPDFVSVPYGEPLTVRILRDLSGMAVHIEGWTFGDEPKAPSVSGNVYDLPVSYSYIEMGASRDTAVTEPPTEAGEYTVIATLYDDQGNGYFTLSADFSVAKKLPIPGEDFELLPLSPAYNGAYQPLLSLSAGDSGLKLWYSFDKRNTLAGVPKKRDAGSYEIWYKVTGGKNYLDRNEWLGPVTASILPASIAGTDLKLDGTLGLRFYVLADSKALDGAYMEFALHGKSERIPAAEAEQSESYLVFTCPVRSIEMAEPVSASFHCGGTTAEAACSIKQYLENLRSNGFTENALLEAIENYGHYVQPYMARLHGLSFGEGGDYAAMPAASSITPLPALTDYQLGYGPEGYDEELVKSMHYNLTLDSATTLNVRLSFKSAPGTVTAAVDGVECPVTDKGNLTYQIEIPNIAANNLGYAWQVQFMADGRTVYDANMSALSYVNTVLTAGQGYEDENLALTALYDFCAAARAYNP